MPVRPVAAAPVADVASAGPRPSPSTIVATLVALGLGAIGAVMIVAGHSPWEGRVAFVITETHGLHVGDVVALIPLAAGAWLARWSWLHGPRA